jgi:para-nitrobenzyl esterase
MSRFSGNQPVRSIYAAGRQSHIPLLAGWNLDEDSFRSFFDGDEPTVGHYVARAKARFGNNAETFLKLHPATTDAQAKWAGRDFAGDEFIAFGTWKWLELQLATGGAPVFRFEFDQTLPLPAGAAPGTEPTAPHASEIEFVFRVLSSKDLPWRQEDWDVSELMSSYWTNFAKTGDPNGPGLPRWPAYNRQDGYQVMHLKANPVAAPDQHRGRYEFLDQLSSDR